MKISIDWCLTDIVFLDMMKASLVSLKLPLNSLNGAPTWWRELWVCFKLTPNNTTSLRMFLHHWHRSFNRTHSAGTSLTTKLTESWRWEQRKVGSKGYRDAIKIQLYIGYFLIHLWASVMTKYKLFYNCVVGRNWWWMWEFVCDQRKPASTTTTWGRWMETDESEEPW